MSTFTKAFVLLVVSGFLCLAAFFAFQGAWGAAAMMAFVAAVVVFIGFQGVFWPWFYKKYPLPERQPWEDPPCVWEQIKIYRQLYPGWPSRLIAAVEALWLLVLALLVLSSLMPYLS